MKRRVQNFLLGLSLILSALAFAWGLCSHYIGISIGRAYVTKRGGGKLDYDLKVFHFAFGCIRYERDLMCGLQGDEFIFAQPQSTNGWVITRATIGPGWLMPSFRAGVHFDAIGIVWGKQASGNPATKSSSLVVIRVVPLWLIALVLGLPAMVVVGQRRARRRRSQHGRCPTCGYDLRATPQRCPECGTIPSSAKGIAT